MLAIQEYILLSWQNLVKMLYGSIIDLIPVIFYG
jgi:hypothetical protein